MFPDLLNWLDGLAGRATHGDLHRFTFTTESGFTGMEVEMLLRRYGIRLWGRAIVQDNELSFLVKRRQAVWAEYLLCRAGVPLTSQLLDPRNADYQQRHTPNTMPNPWNQRGIGPHSLVDHIIDWLDRHIG